MVNRKKKERTKARKCPYVSKKDIIVLNGMRGSIESHRLCGIAKRLESKERKRRMKERNWQEESSIQNALGHWMGPRDALALYGVEDGYCTTLERAQALRERGAYLELDAKGYLFIYMERQTKKPQGEER